MLKPSAPAVFHCRLSHYQPVASATFMALQLGEEVGFDGDVLDLPDRGPYAKLVAFE